MNLKEYLNKDKMHLSWFILKEEILCKLYAGSLSSSFIASAFSILGCYEKVAHLGWLFLTKIYAADLSQDLSDVKQYFQPSLTVHTASIAPHCLRHHPTTVAAASSHLAQSSTDSAHPLTVLYQSLLTVFLLHEHFKSLLFFKEINILFQNCFIFTEKLQRWYSVPYTPSSAPLLLSCITMLRLLQFMNQC